MSSITGLIFAFILIIIGMPYFIMDIKRDKKIREMYEYYKRENKILEIKDNSKKLKVMFIVEIIFVLSIGGLIMMKFVFNRDSVGIDYIEHKDSYTVSLKDGKIIQLEEYEFDNGNFSLIVPLNFVAMDYDMINKKYPNGNPPSYVLSNDRTTVNLVVSATNNPLKNSQIKSYINAMEEQLSGVANIIDTRFFERNGHEIGEIKFISKAVDTDIYNHMIVFSDNDCLRIVSFNCIKELQENWQNAGEYIINSLAFK